jgi:hypothetical protein
LPASAHWVMLLVLLIAGYFLNVRGGMRLRQAPRNCGSAQAGERL